MDDKKGFNGEGYVGQLKDNKMQENGTKTFKNGDVYKGEEVDGLF